MTEEKIIEELAELEHEQWSHWEIYRQKKVIELELKDNSKGTLLTEQLKNWDRLMKTPYSDLTEKEKESDRVWARKVYAIFKEALQKREKEIYEEIYTELIRLNTQSHTALDVLQEFIPYMESQIKSLKSEGEK